MWFVDIKDGTSSTRQSCQFINVNAVPLAGVQPLKDEKDLTEKKYNIRSILARVIKEIYPCQRMFICELALETAWTKQLNINIQKF
jgi:hypothetical protein